jgi:hypothetical protein
VTKRVGELLKIAAERAAQHPAYLGWVLSQFMTSQGISSTALATHLACSEEMMPRLCLCLRPRATQFGQDINAIASTLFIDGCALARIVRQVEAVVAMAEGGLTDRGTLMAARTRPPINPDKGDGASR